MKRRFLLDTQAFVMAASEEYVLSKKASSAFMHEENDILLSMASIWEMLIKMSLKKLVLPVSLQVAIQTAIKEVGIAVLPIQVEHIFRLENLPFHHRDPFDRLLISQALVEGLSIISNDKAFDNYDIQRVW